MTRLATLTAICVFALTPSIFAQAPKGQSVPADNTKINQRDRNTETPTADQQKGSRSDAEITRQVRRSITDDKSLSTYAKNVKVITKDGNVTLRGPVRSEEEKKSIGSKADSIAGADHVKNELEVAARPTK
jgi:hyperosmotically inducible periplasmic protein